MIKLGEIQELEVVKKVDFGVYLKSEDDVNGDDRILLPLKQVPENTKTGDKIKVFVYKDSNDRIIATTKRPKIVMGEITYLKVVQLTRIGAFLNWGLEKDLFLPFKEQVGEIKLNGEYMVGLYVDKSERLCATMNLFNVLRTDSPYKVNDMVKGTVFSLKRGLGAMVAVDGKYLGLIHEGEILKPLHAGQEVELRVSHIKEDGKLDLSLKDAPRLQIDKDGEKILNAITRHKGFLPVNDDSSPEIINEKLGLSKSSFKKAVGRLMKRNVIEMTNDGIRLSDGSKKSISDKYSSSSSRQSSTNNRQSSTNNRQSSSSKYGSGNNKQQNNSKYGSSTQNSDKYSKNGNKQSSSGEQKSIKSYGKSSSSNRRPKN